ncbi:MAG: hypothetical protein QGD94_09995, partial [Planctomycetia bacterium]|nr:hypothetical protein [Planctomycetia bacterium]
MGGSRAIRAAVVLLAVLMFGASSADAQRIKGIKYIRKSKDGLASDEISDIEFDGKRVWIATHEGLYLKEGNKWRHISRKDGLP